MPQDGDRWRCDECGRFIADRYPYHKCSDCQDRANARRRMMERIDQQLARAADPQTGGPR